MAELQNFSLDVPVLMPRPTSGSTTYRITIFVRDATGALLDPDSNIAAVNVTDQAGVSYISNMGAITRESQGQYSGLYTVSSAHALVQLRFAGYANISAVTKYEVKSAVVTDSSSSGTINGLTLDQWGTAMAAVVLGVARPHIVQTVTLNGTPTGGTFTLAYRGQATTALAYDASTTTVQTALRALSTIGGTNATVTGSAGAWVVTFGGTLDLDALKPLSSTSSLTGGTSPSVSIETTVRYYKRDGSTLSTTITYKPQDGMRSGSAIS